MKEIDITEFYTIRELTNGKWIVWDKKNNVQAKDNEYPTQDVAKIVAESLQHLC